MDGTGFEPATGIEPAWMAGASGRARSHEDEDGMEWMWMEWIPWQNIMDPFHHAILTGYIPFYAVLNYIACALSMPWCPPSSDGRAHDS